jgi:deoxyribodipyrimidine photo-lyase
MKAIAQSEEIIPVYCFDDAHFESTQYGFKKIIVLNFIRIITRFR